MVSNNPSSLPHNMEHLYAQLRYVRVYEDRTALNGHFQHTSIVIQKQSSLSRDCHYILVVGIPD